MNYTISSLLLLLRLSILAMNSTAATTNNGQFIYTGFAGAKLTLDGVATVTSAGLLQLTNGTGALKAHAFHPDPLRFRDLPVAGGGGSGNGNDVRSFSVSFVFAILSIYPNLSSHGMAFFVSPTNNLSAAAPRSYLCLFSNKTDGDVANHIFALDTIQNTDFIDINNNHIGVDINSIRSVGSYPTGYYDDGDNGNNLKNLTLNSHEPMRIWIDYDQETTRIDVTVAPLEISKPKRPLGSVIYNLSTVLTDSAYVGFSSSSGDIDSQYYVLGWSFAMNGAAPAIDISKLPKLPREGPKSSSKVMEITLPIATAMFVLVIGVIVLHLLRRRPRYAELREDWEVEFGPHRFSYKDLFDATKGFKNKYLLGSGGFGSVYRGVLKSSNMEVAVKRISHESRQGIKEFIAEVVSIGRLRHRNLVQLLGYCRRKGELLLFYEYMPNGSLDKYLHGQEDKNTLDWAHRFHIIKGIASGVLYLHEEWDQVIVHLDIKASNVLLDSDMNGRLGGFGLAKLYDHGIDPQTTHVVGTMGYLAPELVRTGKASPLTDVFAFGAFLLEVTCGRRPVEHNRQDNRVMLVDRVLEHWHKGLLTKAIDERLQGEFDTDEACLVLKLELLCSHPVPQARPSMRQAMQYLDGDMKMPKLIPANLSFDMQAMMSNEGFDSYMMPYPSSSMVSHGTFMSGLSGGR
uniref:non-specific serine/threonine protein kinase n=1 Tax=Oryza nivara TaxID=4536 RepID=A0A0E0HWC4_ORYNI